MLQVSKQSTEDSYNDVHGLVLPPNGVASVRAFIPEARRSH